MNFYNYPEIINVLDTKAVNEAIKNYPNITWYAFEKIKGYEYTINSNGIIGKVAAKDRELPAGNNYFNHTKVLNRYGKPVKTMAKDAGHKNISVFGNIFGGKYGEYTNSISIKCPIQYSPNIEFMAFDIAEVARNRVWFLGVKDAMQHCENYKIPYVPLIGKGSLEYCLSLSPVFESRIHEVFQVPKLENNFAEGLIIVPENAIYENYDKRLMFKSINPEYLSNKWKHDLKKKDKKHLNDVADSIMDNINPSDIANIIHSSNSREFSKIIKLCYSNVLQKMEDYLTLDKKEKKVVNKLLNREVIGLVKQELKKHG